MSSSAPLPPEAGASAESEGAPGITGAGSAAGAGPSPAIGGASRARAGRAPGAGASRASAETRRTEESTIAEAEATPAALLGPEPVGFEELGGGGLALALRQQGVGLPLGDDAGRLGGGGGRGGRGRGGTGGGGPGPGHGDVVEHVLGAVGRDRRHDVHLHGLAGLGLGLVVLADGHQVAGLGHQGVIEALAGLGLDRHRAGQVPLPERPGGRGHLGRLVFPDAVGEVPGLHVEGDRLGLLELVVLQHLAGFLELGQGGGLVADQAGGRGGGLGPGLGDRLGQLGRGLVEEAVLDRHLLDLADDPAGLVVVALLHLLAGGLEHPAGLLLGVAGPPGRGGVGLGHDGRGRRGGHRRRRGRGGLDGGVDRGGVELGEVVVELGLLGRPELVAIIRGNLEVLRGERGVALLVEADATLEVVRGGRREGGRVVGVAEDDASSGGEPSVAAPHAPRVKRIVSVLSLPNATSFRRFRAQPPTSLAAVLPWSRGGRRESGAPHLPAFAEGQRQLTPRFAVGPFESSWCRSRGGDDREPGEDEAVSYPAPQNRSSAIRGDLSGRSRGSLSGPIVRNDEGPPVVPGGPFLERKWPPGRFADQRRPPPFREPLPFLPRWPPGAREPPEPDCRFVPESFNAWW